MINLTRSRIKGKVMEMTEEHGDVREYLEGERDRLLEEVASSTERNDVTHNSDPFIQKEESAKAYSEYEKKFTQMRTSQERLLEVERAIDKLNKGTYGLCDRCGKPIPPARLEALPQTTYCLECKVRMSSIIRK